MTSDTPQSDINAADARASRNQPSAPDLVDRMSEWKNQLDAFESTFRGEMSAILDTLAHLSQQPSEPQVERSHSTTDPSPWMEDHVLCETQEFVLEPSSASAEFRDLDPNRLAALKARLSQQMASSELSSQQLAPNDDSEVDQG